MIRAEFNGEWHSVDEGLSIIAAARRVGIEIPSLCHDERLDPIGACRLCLVEIKGEPHPAAACVRKVAEGIEVTTNSGRLEAARAMNLRMLARSYPAEAFQKFPEKPFHRTAAKYGLRESDFCDEASRPPVDGSHPFITVDMSRCINCYRCVRICDEVQGQFVWQVVGRGEDSRIVPDSFADLGSSACVGCGACADTCPTGAIDDRTYLENGEPDNWTKTVCPYCGTGCEMEVGTKEHKIVQIRPLEQAPVNRGHLCVKGRYAFDYVASEDRVTEPMIRRGGDWVNVTWDEAIDHIAVNLKRLISEHGAESIAVLGSARATNEENFITQKFVRVVLGTNNVDCCARVCHTPTAAAMKMMLGTGAATNSFTDIELARAILVCGANPTENHPIPGARIKRAVREGARLIVVDPRRTELASLAEIHLQIRPGTNIPLLNAMAGFIIEEGLFDKEFLAERVTGFEELREFLKSFPVCKAAEICGVEERAIRSAASIYAGAKPAMSFHGLGVTEHTQGTEGVMCIVNLALLTGNIGKRGSGVNPLRGQNNVQGSAQMGCDPGILTGSIAVADGREHFEKVWGAPISTAKGLNVLQMVDAARDGRLRALWCVGYDVFLTNANANETAKALSNLELCIIQDMFLNETAKQFGHVFLPVASSFEKEGTFMNAERRVQRVRRIIDPPGNCRTDWEIICDVAKALGNGRFFDHSSAEEIWNEVRMVWPDAYGITYERLERMGLQWNCPSVDHPGSEVLHGSEFPIGKTAALRKVDYRPTGEVADGEYPFILNTGRSLYQFNAGTMTQRTGAAKIRAADQLSISSFDAAALEILGHEMVQIVSRYGKAKLEARIDPAVRKGELFATFHDQATFLNRVTGPRRDRYVLAPEYKVTAVRIEKLARADNVSSDPPGTAAER